MNEASNVLHIQPTNPLIATFVRLPCELQSGRFARRFTLLACWDASTTNDAERRLVDAIARLTIATACLEAALVILTGGDAAHDPYSLPV